MNRKVSYTWSFALVGLVFFGIHLCFCFSPFVNLESWPAGAAELVLHGKLREGLLFHDQSIANPLGSVIGIVPFYFAFGVSTASARLYSIVCGTVMILMFKVLQGRIGVPGAAPMAAGFIALNPYFWVWSGLVYSDAPFCLFVSLSVFAAVLAARLRRSVLYLFSALMFSLATLTKYSAIVFVPVLVVVAAVESYNTFTTLRKRYWSFLGKIGIYLLVGSCIVIPYLAWVYASKGNIISPRWAGSTVPSLSLYPWRFISEVIWLGVFSAPFALFALLRLAADIGRLRCVAVCGVLALIAPAAAGGFLHAQATESSFGEMHLGWWGWLFPFKGGIEITAALLFVLGGTVLVSITFWTLKDLKQRYVYGVWVLSVLALHGLMRCTNRYMLAVVPPLAIYFADSILHGTRVGRYLLARRVALALGVAVSFVLCIFNSTYFSREGIAAARVAFFVNSQGLDGVEGGTGNSIWCHSRYLVGREHLVDADWPSDRIKFRAVTLRRGERVAGILYEEPVVVAGVTFKRYAIVRSQ